MAEKQNDQEINEGRFFAVISYIGFLCVVALVLKKENKFGLFHAKQGLIIFVLEVAAFVLSVIPLLGWVIGVFGYALFLLVSLWGMLKAFLGQYYRIPVVSRIADNVVL